MSSCKMCNVEIDFDIVSEDIASILEKADAFGAESLTEEERMIFEGKICSPECYEELKVKNS